MASLFVVSLRSPVPISHRILRPTSVQQTSLHAARAFKTHINTASRPRYHFHFPRKANTTRTYSTVVVQDRPRGRTRSILTTVFLSLGSFVIGGYFALSTAPPFLTALVMGSMPTDEDTLKYEAPDQWTKELDDHIKDCKLAQTLRASPDYRESRPHLKIPPEVAQHNLTAGTLSGPNMIPVPPYYFNHKDGKNMVCIFYVGTHVSGHPGVVHGGFLATMLDEGLARCAFPALPNKVGVTAQLNIAYKKPTMAGQFLVLIAETTRVEGRKAWSQGAIAPLEEVEVGQDGAIFNGNDPLVSADALFIEPKHAKVRQHK